jgi:predicted transcriptional regulator
MPDDEKKMYSMELPRRLVEQLDQVARWNHRSRQGEMAAAIEEHVKREIKKRNN